ncbi:glycosyltransferase [Actinoallomurus spadix]|uniref:Glycosyltransferase family 1 protein n=1 Tax=Actinoallomurus spadix TaxID=79912 RepID=A0ABP3FXP1_9ACTN|nr:glycosyltransferase [Actinoallomurus spadix]MCO5986352.1 glycosyltransferase [Actinoallomurus spadix]
MNIDMVSEHASPLATLGGADAGGQNVHVGALAVALAERGHEVVVHTRRDDADLPDSVPFAPGVTVEHVPAGPARPIPKDDLLPYMTDFAAHLGRRWLSRPPDIVHAHFWMSGLAALGGARDHGVPVVQTFHALGRVKRRYQRDADTSPAGRVRLEGQVGRDATAVVATCTDEVRELGAYGVPPDRVFVVPCGVDTERFRPDGPVSERDGARPRVLTVGRLVPRKGVDTLLEAMRRVPDADLLIAGGPERSRLGDDPEARRLMSLAEEYGVTDRVVFLGRVAHDEIPALVRSADVVVSVPWYEPFGIVPIEAMACGVPVVASAVGGHLDTVLDGVTGLRVPPRRPDELAASLRRLLGDAGLRRSLSRAAAEHAHGRYSWDRVAAETESVYEQVIETARERLAFAEGARS